MCRRKRARILMTSEMAEGKVATAGASDGHPLQEVC